MARISKTSKEMDRFREWLTANGAEVLAPTNPYELMRYRSDEGTAVIYTNKSGRWSFVGGSDFAFSYFKAGKPMRFTRSTPHRFQGDPVRRALAARDGDFCFYHDGPIAEGEETVEHLVSRTHGGPDHIANKFLSCRACNVRAGHLSAPEKIRLRDAIKAERDTAPPADLLCEAA